MNFKIHLVVEFQVVSQAETKNLQFVLIVNEDKLTCVLIVNSARPIPVQEHRAFGERSFL